MELRADPRQLNEYIDIEKKRISSILFPRNQKDKKIVFEGSLDDTLIYEQ